jgi:hypothetical protein
MPVLRYRGKPLLGFQAATKHRLAEDTLAALAKNKAIPSSHDSGSATG